MANENEREKFVIITKKQLDSDIEQMWASWSTKTVSSNIPFIQIIYFTQQRD